MFLFNVVYALISNFNCNDQILFLRRGVTRPGLSEEGGCRGPPWVHVTTPSVPSSRVLTATALIVSLQEELAGGWYGAQD